MFVFKSTHEEAIKENIRLIGELSGVYDLLRDANQVITQYRRRYELLRNENAKLKMFNQNSEFAKKEVSILLSLCHPDKHDGKQIASDMTRRLLELKRK